MSTFPIRCFQCNKVIGALYRRYIEGLRRGETKKTTLDTLGLHRICCRRMFLCHDESIDRHLMYRMINKT